MSLQLNQQPLFSEDGTRNPFRLKTCLGYFKIHQAVTIFGIVATMGMFADFAGGYYTIGCVRAIEVTAFFTMTLRDNHFTRMCYFYSFVFSVVAGPGLFLLGVDGVTEKLDISKAAKRSCEHMSEKELDQHGYESVEDCEEQMYTVIWWVMAIIVPLYLILQLYFIIVVFAHWKNWKKKQSEGGCIPDNDTEKLSLSKHVDQDPSQDLT